MGRRAQPDWLKELRGNPHGHKLFASQPLPTEAEIMAIASDSSPLGFLERHARSGGDAARPKPGAPVLRRPKRARKDGLGGQS